MSDTGLDGPRGVRISSSTGNGGQNRPGSLTGTEDLTSAKNVQTKPKKDYKGFVAGVFSGIAKLSGGLPQLFLKCLVIVFIY